MNLWWLALIIPAGLFVLTFLIYFFNLDMKFMAIVYKQLSKYHDNKKKESKL